MGNSEVGHLNLGAGRPVLQDLPRIDAAIADGSFFERPAFLAACDRARDGRAARSTSSASSGRAASTPTTGTSSPWSSWRARRGVPRVRVHALLDGRDTPPSLGARVRRATSRRGSPRPTRTRAIAIGRRALLRDGPRPRAGTASSAATTRSSTARRRSTPRRRPRPSRRPTPAARPTSSSTPTVIDGVDGAVARRRPDHPRQLPGRPGPPADPRPGRRRRRSTASTGRRRRAGRRPTDLLVVTMTEYEAGLPVEVAFPPEIVALARRGGLRGRLAPVPRRRDREVRPRDVLLQRRRRGGLSRRGPPAHPEPEGRDLRPRAGDERGRASPTRWSRRSGRATYDFIVANYANPDMVGHTGVWDATIAALGDDRRLPRPGRRRDRGGRRRRPRRRPARCSRSPPTTATPTSCATPTGHPVTAHSLNPVPFVLVGRAAARSARSRDGVLADVAPTLLELAGLPRWDGMTGRSPHPVIASVAVTASEVVDP